MDKIERAIDDIRRKWAPDGRLAVFEISLLPKGVGGVTSSRDARGELIAAGHGSDGKFVDSLQYLAAGGAPLGDPKRLNRNTTLAVIATNADLDRVQLQALAQSGSDALARRITPYGSLFDGDVIFAVSTAAVQPKSAMQVDAIAALVVPEAVERAVRRG